jgi:transcriptional regulator GlxA family with amidase domain
MKVSQQRTPNSRVQPITRGILILASPPCNLLNVTGTFEVFGTANRLLAGSYQPYQIEVASSMPERLVMGYSGLPVLAHRYYRDVDDRVDTLLLAGGRETDPGTSAGLVQWIIEMSTKVRRVASTCTGAFLLAKTGLLDGKKATTHWAHVREFAAQFPKVQLDPDPIWLRDGKFYTSAGVTSGMDLALALVEEDLGSKVALAVARQLVLFLRRPGGQSQFSRALEAQLWLRKPLQETVVWASDNLDKDLSVESLAARAAMSRRNFTRVFATELGTSPAHYIEQLRIEAARRLLEESPASVEEIAAACGFSSAELMRRAFLRAIKSTPSQYRERFRSAGKAPVKSPIRIDEFNRQTQRAA